MEKHQESAKHFYRQALNLCLAMIAQQLILNLITIIDNVMVGRYGDLFVSSAAIVNRLFTVPSSFLNGILAGGVVFLAQYAGIDQPQRMTQTFRFSLAASIALLFPFILAGLAFPQTLVRLFSSDPALEGPAAVYLQLLALSMIPYVLSQAIANAMRAIGQVRLPLWGSCAAVIVKILANLILLEGIPGGMLGAGLAMLLCRCAEALILIVLMKRSRCVFARAWKTTPKMPRSLAIQIGKTMLPIGLNELFYGLGLAMLFKGYSSFSTPMTAGYAIAMTYYELFRVLFPAAGTVLTILVGPVLGQGKKAEAREVVRRVFKLALGLSIAFGILIYLCRWTIPLIYTGSALSLRTADHGAVIPAGDRTFSCVFRLPQRRGQPVDLSDRFPVHVDHSDSLVDWINERNQLAADRGLLLGGSQLCTEMSVSAGLVEKGTMAEQSDPAGGFAKRDAGLEAGN